MTTANIDTIAASLRDCSLASSGGNGGDRSPQHLADFIAAGEITLDLNSDSALPCHWEQRLDMRTGEIYYINWKTGIKATADLRPSTSAAAAPAYSSSDEEATSDEYSCVSCIGSGASYDEDDDDHSDDSSSVSSASPPPPAHVLVAAGCKGCFMYFMVPKHADACPKCGGGGLLHLGLNGSI
ncbi:uncharacterized protein LOC122053506 [Zingiber officinale]|uniref:WW domain-containing protein n=1 Tax=Zingiber officinale TaxID=94328 RepID=A0A8J5LHZ7_ZINOF|nr:uncharacterized protein LOC122053506 [Zingiber officinale]KAG6519958.1 hypothetical protein ZIOFF_016987 [Zingiber officinale]